MPKVSVVIPTFGRPELLKRAIDSVLEQTVQDLEVITVVDGDDPKTAAYLASITDPRSRYIIHDSKKGAGMARNTGAIASKGEWVAFLDDDDHWLPEKLAGQLAVAPAEPAVIINKSHVITPYGNFIRPANPYKADQPFDEWLFDRKTWFKGGQTFLQTSSIMVPRAMFETLQFRDTNQHEEWELCIRAVKQLGYRFITAPEVSVIHYQGGIGASQSKASTWQDSIQWINTMQGLVTRRAYSGFCLTVIGQTAANRGVNAAFWPLLSAAFRKGSPTLKQLLAYFLLWMLPMNVRRVFRAKRNSAPMPVEATA
jgi:GT2 family glycosyltransferase